MSILLEALRKSEKGQRPVAPPGINDDVPPVTAQRSFRPALLVSLLAIVLVVTGWFAWRQYRPPADGYQPPVSLTADRQLPAQPVQKKPDGQRTPVESYQGAEKNPSPPGQKKSATVSSTIEDRAPTATARSKGKQSRPVATAKVVVFPQTETVPKIAKPDDRVFQAGEPAPISYWELPDTVREDVPEIKFSVLVFASRSADRFVLIDGQRLTEGDSLPSGPQIVEIRLDGVVFSYRLYRFLVER